jgi:hypothetical protein
MDEKVSKGTSQTKLEALKEALIEAARYLSSLKHADKVIVSIILFSTGAWVLKKQVTVAEVLSLDLNIGLLNSLLRRWTTAIGKGIRLASKTFEEVQANLASDANKTCAFFLLSDGEENMGSNPLQAAEEIKVRGHLVFTVAFGEKADRDLLREMASKPEWACEAHDMKSLMDVFKFATRTASRTLGVQ